LERLPGLTLINGYGPTEGTTFTSCFRLTDPGQVGTNVSIGRPITNTRIYVLDFLLRPVAVGVAGELYAGGEGLARGYLGRPDLTAERFIPDPFAGPGQAGGRLYRTGDLVRWRADGNLEFQGRLDSQLKIRGFRVEPAEIEAVLLATPGVQRAAVTGVGPAGTKRLAAFWVGNATTEEVRSHLRRQLPPPMMPSDIVQIPELPLTPNGKVDRRALADMAAAASGAARPAAERVPPRTALEEALVEACANVLGRDPREISVMDNFFALGGHSLLAIRLVSRLGQAPGISPTLQLVFEAATLAELAERMVEQELENASGELLDEVLHEMEAAR
jgi:hypothetical protein